jgi:hypothetical protein
MSKQNKNRCPGIWFFCKGYVTVWTHSQIGIGFAFSVKEWYAYMSLPFINIAFGSEKAWCGEDDLSDNSDEKCFRCGSQPQNKDSHYCNQCIEERRIMDERPTP